MDLPLLWSNHESQKPRKGKKVVPQQKVINPVPRTDVSDTFYIREKVSESMSLNDRINYRIEVTPTKPACFRVSVWSRKPVKVVDSYWVEKVADGYIFIPSLRVAAEKNSI